MSFDIAILDDNGRPGETVSLTVDEHWELVQLAGELHLDLWPRMSDYYADTTFGPAELDDLASETVRLVDACRKQQIAEKLGEFAVLVRKAKEIRCGIVAIAD